MSIRRSLVRPSTSGRLLHLAVLVLVGLGSLAVAGCDSPPTRGRDGGMSDSGSDAGPPMDSGPAIDAGADAATDASALADAGPVHCIEHTPSSAPSTGDDRIEDARGTATVTSPDPSACARTYVLSTTATRRDALPANPRSITERSDAPSIRTGHLFFDALHALAIEETQECMVDAISDWAFDDGRSVPCGAGGCFETGRLWNYVWTRDTAYSVDLGLAAIDPTRSLNSLSFKLSDRRGGGSSEIVQDTGTGGSWPVSTDRVTWALGAQSLLPWLDEAQRSAFADRALRALRNTLARDREVAFDPSDGLYRGEQSFLDWREQTYPAFTSGHVVSIAEAKSLSTNLMHLRALEVAADLATLAGDTTAATRWRGWATALRTAIRSRLWVEEDQLFATFTGPQLDPSAVRRYDLLGESLAILTDVADPAQARAILSSYPHYGPAAAVTHPQQQFTRIYHNRGEWPFVTSYWLRAARHADHGAVGDRALDALVRGAALFLSNMENFESPSGEAFVEDGMYSGPVVNSQRQLWSVAGYLSMVHHVVFGAEASAEGLRFRPWITPGLRNTMFANADQISLRRFPYRGVAVDVVVHLPPVGSGSDGQGAFRVASVSLDGAPVDDAFTPSAMLREGARFEVFLSATAGPASTLTEVADTSAWQELFGPRTPSITSIALASGRPVLSIDLGGEAAADVTVDIYRDGELVAEGRPGSAATYTDAGADDAATVTHCWAIATRFVSSGTRSQHSAPNCYWGMGSARVSVIGASAMTAIGGTASSDHGRFHYSSWGDLGHSLRADFTAPTTGRYMFQVLYGNGAGPLDTGITCAIKRVVVEDASDGSMVGQGVLVMPQLGEWSRWENSSLVAVTLTAGRSYRILIRGDDGTANMSAFAHFSTYTGGTGGRSGEFSRVNIAELRVLRY